MVETLEAMNLLLFTVVISAVLIVERALHALSFTLLYLTCRTLPSEKAKAVLSLQISSGTINTVFSIASSLCGIAVQTAAVLMQWAFTVFAMLLLSVVLYIVFQYANDLMFEAGMTYNKTLGPSLQILIVYPLKIFTWFFEQLCPIWNAAVWLWKKIPPQLMVETITRNLGLVQSAVQEFGQILVSLAMSLLSWVQSFSCCRAGQTEGCNARCFEAGERIFDFLTPMAHLRNFVAYGCQWLREMCYVASGPMDLATFPIMDINFAKGVHFVANSAIYAVFHVPAVTVERCNRFRADGAIMCVPDFEPVFNMMTSGFSYLGQFMDNWLDILVLIVEGSLGRPSPPCSTVPDLLKDFDFQASTFGSNETIIVGMTEHMFARTDGNSVHYFSLERDWQTVVHRDAFPFDVDTRYGVAAVSHFSDADHDPKGDDTTALLGCACGYGSQGITITCGVAMFTDAVPAEQRIVPVQFQLPSTGQLLSCSKVLVRVESIRWPVSRFTATRVQRTDGSYAQDVGCSSKGTCLQVSEPQGGL